MPVPAALIADQEQFDDSNISSFGARQGAALRPRTPAPAVGSPSSTQGSSEASWQDREAGSEVLLGGAAP